MTATAIDSVEDRVWVAGGHFSTETLYIERGTRGRRRVCVCVGGGGVGGPQSLTETLCISNSLVEGLSELVLSTSPKLQSFLQLIWFVISPLFENYAYSVDGSHQ